MQNFYANKVLKVHKDGSGMSVEDIKTCLVSCGCDQCLIELKNFEINKAYMKINADREECKFCGKPTTLDPKTKKHSCKDCG